MEHSALHAFELVGQIIALGGIFLVWGILRPAVRKLDRKYPMHETILPCFRSKHEEGLVVFSRKLQASVKRWIYFGLLMSAAATFLNLFVEVAEVQGKTVFGGVSLRLVLQFISGTMVGRLEIARTGVLLLTAGVMRFLMHPDADEPGTRPLREMEQSEVFIPKNSNLCTTAPKNGAQTVPVRISPKARGTGDFSNAGLRTPFEPGPLTLTPASGAGKIHGFEAQRVLPTKSLSEKSNTLVWCLVVTGILAGIFLTSVVSHSAALPTNRLADVSAQIAHIVTAALWMGVLIQLLAARHWIEGEGGQENIGLVAEIVRRFSPVALAATSLLMVSGLFLVSHLGGSADAVVTSAYGLVLMVKLALLAPAVFAGWVNFHIIRPQLIACAAADSETPAPARQKAGILKRFGRMLELEVTAGVLLITVAGILASVSPPGEIGTYRLTPTQIQALRSPRLPGTTLPDPATFYGSSVRQAADFQYSEFSHHWSGVMVILLGLGWWLQAAGGKTGKWAGLSWPFLLVPFAGYVMVISDPEIWILHRVGFWDVLADQQLLEHKLGAVILILLAWYGWRDRRTPPAKHPLGYVLPVICVAGGALLLGHVHSTLDIDDGLSHLISYQHVIFGAFMLFSGVVRWLMLRGLFPRRIGNMLWPAFICALGVFMAFFYREVM